MTTNLRALRSLSRISYHRNRQSLSTFSFSASVAPQVLTAKGTLPYAALAIYEIITDIASYPDFIPYIVSSRVLEQSKPDAHYKRPWPQLASLRIGYGDTINEEFTSRLLCVPPVPQRGRAGVGIVEAVSGSSIQGLTEIPPEKVAHHTHPSLPRPFSGTGASAEDSPLEFLRTRWTLYPFSLDPALNNMAIPRQSKLERTSEPQQRTDVMLSIEYKFRNRVYDMLGSAVAPRMAESMLLTFQRRVESVLGGA